MIERLLRWQTTVMVLWVTLLAALVRFVSLGNPRAVVFDEVYYARGAYSLYAQGFEGRWDGEPDLFAEGDFSGLTTTGDYVVHPPLGKWIIAIGIKLFGPNPFGWRFSTALLGVLVAVMVALIARHLFQSTIWGAVAGTFVALEGQSIVMSRTALLDGVLTFFVVLAFALLLLDRHRYQQQLAQSTPIAWLARVRWWRFAAMLSLGAACGVKWSGAYFAAVFLVLSVFSDAQLRKAAGHQSWFAKAVIRNGLPAAALSLVVIPAVYVATWIPWLRGTESYGRGWALDNPGQGITWLPEGLRSLVEYHRKAMDFHTGLSTPHNYDSPAIEWLVQRRPTAFYFQDVESNCESVRCVSAIHALGHPLIWWIAIGGLILAVYALGKRFDWVAAAVLSGVVAGWVPWLFYPERTIFSFYTVVFAPWIILALIYLLKRIAQPPSLQGRWHFWGTMAAGGITAAIIVFAGFFLPIWTGDAIPYDYWQVHMWSNSWI